MQTTVYRASLSKHNKKFQLKFAWAGIALAALAVLLLGVHLLYASRVGDLSRISLQEIVYVIGVLCMGGVSFVGRLAILPARNFIALDDTGLTYIRLGLGQRWQWRDLPLFTLTDRPHGTRVIEFRPPWSGGWRPWVVWIVSGSYRPGMIPVMDEYDTPLEDIAATLNEYRERALDGKPTTDGRHNRLKGNGNANGDLQDFSCHERRVPGRYAGDDRSCVSLRPNRSV